MRPVEHDARVAVEELEAARPPHAGEPRADRRLGQAEPLRDGRREEGVAGLEPAEQGEPRPAEGEARPLEGHPLPAEVPRGHDRVQVLALDPRSEERRVGKECRARCAPEMYKKKQVYGPVTI